MKAVLDRLIVLWLLISPLCWILRDGLGPTSMDSAGSDAILRFMFTFYWGPIMAALLLARLLLEFAQRMKKAQKPRP